MAQKASTIGKYAAEKGNTAALGDARTRMTSEKALCDYSIQEALLTPYKNHVVGVVKRSTYKTQLLNSQSTLKHGNAIISLRI